MMTCKGETTGTMLKHELKENVQGTIQLSGRTGHTAPARAMTRGSPPVTLTHSSGMGACNCTQISELLTAPQLADADAHMAKASLVTVLDISTPIVTRHCCHHKAYTLQPALCYFNPLPAPGIVVGAVHGCRGTRSAARAQGRPRGRLVAPDGSPVPPKCEVQ